MERQKSEVLSISIGRGSYLAGDSQAVNSLSGGSLAGDDGFPTQTTIAVDEIPFHPANLPQGIQHSHGLSLLELEPVVQEGRIIQIQNYQAHRRRSLRSI